MRYMTCTGIGQDSHRFLPSSSTKPCIVAGVLFEGAPGLDADSDGDVVFHALCNAITSLTHKPILGKIAIDLCKKGVRDSHHYLEAALQTLPPWRIEHISLAIEGAYPRFEPHSLTMRETVAKRAKISKDQVGITFTSGDALTPFGRKEGLMCFCALTASRPLHLYTGDKT